MRLKKTLVGAVAALSTLAVAGCGSAVDISGSHTANLSSSSFVTAVSDATSQAQSVHVEGTITAQGQHVSVVADQAAGDGTVSGVHGTIRATVPGMGAIEARVVGGVLYLQAGQLGIAQAGKPWVKVDLTDTSNPIGKMLSQLSGSLGPDQFAQTLKGLSSLRKLGTETVDGVATTHYQVTIDTARLTTVLGFHPGQLGSAGLPKTLSYQVWLDSSSRPVEVSMSTPTFGVELHFSRWGEAVHVVAPPASQVSTFSL